MKRFFTRELFQSWYRLIQRMRQGTAANQQSWNDSDPGRPITLAQCVSVVIPALNESRRIAEVVEFALSDPCTAEVIVIDDSSTDATVELARAAGARVLTSSMLGKGASMQDGVQAARCDVLVYLDGDLTGLRPGLISDLCAPILRDDADFVKARFGRSGGRVTELTAKPMIKIFFPELAGLAQPLGGVIAARRALLKALRFEDGYGVDVGLLIDASLSGARVAEVDIGSLEHDSQALEDLTLMANEVGRVIFQRARSAGRLHVDQILAMYEVQRQATASISFIMSRRKARKRLLLLDLDGTVTQQNFFAELALATGHQQEYRDALERVAQGSASAEQAMASTFRYVHRARIEHVARQIAIRPGLIETVNGLRRAGFFVGVISSGWFIAAEIIRRRIFADFAIAHTVQFDNDTCGGLVRLNPAFLPPDADESTAPPTKDRALASLIQQDGEQPFDSVWAVGNAEDDLEMLRRADRAFLIGPQAEALKPLLERATILTHTEDLLAEIDEQALAA